MPANTIHTGEHSTMQARVPLTRDVRPGDIFGHLVVTDTSDNIRFNKHKVITAACWVCGNELVPTLEKHLRTGRAHDCKSAEAAFNHEMQRIYESHEMLCLQK